MNTTISAETSMPPSARQCAVQILSEVLDHKRPFDEAVARHSGLASLSERDRNFARLLVMTALRRLGQIDALLALILEKPLQGKSQTVMHVLRLGVVQLLWLATPAHAAVHAMVETVAQSGHENMKGLVNAVLKRVAKEGAAITSAQEGMLNVPQWLYASWRSAYGEETARAIAAAALSEPPLDITVKANAGEWAQQLGGTVLPTGSVRLVQAGRVDALPGYHQGEWWVQDAAAALPVQLLGDVRGKTIFDLCAAPGGKTAQLAARGARVIAVDKSKRRLTLLQANMDRLKYSIETVESDILKWKPDVIADVILLDAPCSATGTIRRHPEVMWHRKEEDVTELAELQKRLLNRAASWLTVGGQLLYCTCSLQPEEGEKQAEKFLAAHERFKLVSSMPKGINLPDKAGLNGAQIRTNPWLWGDQGGMDGFYAILLQAIK